MKVMRPITDGLPTIREFLKAVRRLVYCYINTEVDADWPLSS